MQLVNYNKARRWLAMKYAVACLILGLLFRRARLLLAVEIVLIDFIFIIMPPANEILYKTLEGTIYRYCNLDSSVGLLDLTWEESEVGLLANDKAEWRRRVAQCIHLVAG